MVWVAALSACAPGASVDTPAKTDPIPFQLDARGVQLVDRAGRIDFGRTDHSTERAMTKLVGQGVSSRAICDDGSPFVTWPDGSTLYFRNGAFRGWSATAADGTLRQGGRTCA